MTTTDLQTSQLTNIQGLLAPLISVEQQLNQLRRKYERRDDARKVFTFAYELITRDLIRTINSQLSGRSTPPYFRDVAWVVRLIQAFADTYIEAVRAYDAGSGLFAVDPARRQVNPWWWQKVFDEIGVGQETPSSVLEALVYPILAHIVADLPYALLEVGFDRTHLPDFHRLNDLIAAAIDPVQQRVSCRYAQRQLIADQLLGRSDELLSASGIWLARSLAWYNALRLTDECRQTSNTNGRYRAPQTASMQMADHYVHDSSAVQRPIRRYVNQFVEFHLTSHLIVRICFQLARFFSRQLSPQRQPSIISSSRLRWRSPSRWVLGWQLIFQQLSEPECLTLEKEDLIIRKRKRR